MQANLTRFITLLLFFAISLPLSAQMQMGMGLQFGTPTGKLKAADYRDGGGIWMEMLSPEIPNSMPVGLQFGVQMDYNFSGSYSEKITVEYPVPSTGDIEISNESLGMTGIVRLISPEAVLRVYGDARLGTRLVMSNESLMVDDHDSFDESGCQITNITKTWTFAYGLSGGMQVRVSPRIALDFRATYTQGGKADFVDLNSVYVQEKADTRYNLQQSSRTGFWLFQAGLNMAIKGGCF